MKTEALVTCMGDENSLQGKGEKVNFALREVMITQRGRRSISLLFL